MSSFEPHDGPAPLDRDESWIVETDEDRFELELPDDLAPLLLDRLARGSRGWEPDVQVDVQEPTGPRTLDEAAVRGLVDDASATCRAAAEHGIDIEELVVLAQAASLLATVWSIALDVDEAESLLRVDDDDRFWVGALGKLAADCELMLLAAIRPRRDGTFSLHWRVFDKVIVGAMVEEVRSLLSTDDPAIVRLFPSAYGNDDERNAGWDVLMRGELIEQRLASLAVVEDLLGREHCDADELNRFLRAVNDARLVLASRLGIDDENAPPDIRRRDRKAQAMYEAYEHLSFLLSQTIRALRGSL